MKILISNFVNRKCDQCDQCISYKNASDEEKKKRASEYADHINNKNLTKELKRICKEEEKSDTTKKSV